VIAYIKGALTQLTSLFAVIESGGIGYKILIPANLFAKLPALQEEVLLYTAFVIRENSQTLYGFLNSEDRELFEALMNVTGVGPKMALNIIGHLSGRELQRAIHNHEIATISKVPGIGKKTAERLMIEMRDKIPAILLLDPEEHAVYPSTDPHAQKIKDAMSALINLGYNQLIAQQAIKKCLKELPETIELSELITAALKNI
jgi:Holliday junction DNA helicase RuvA